MELLVDVRIPGERSAPGVQLNSPLQQLTAQCLRGALTLAAHLFNGFTPCRAVRRSGSPPAEDDRRGGDCEQEEKDDKQSQPDVHAVPPRCFPFPSIICSS